MSDDDRLDAVLRQAAADEYNPPPQIVPREAMWDAVQQGLGSSVIGHRSSGFGGAGAPSPDGRVPMAESRWLRRVFLAAAAVILLAVGIQLGRMMGRPVDQIAQSPTLDHRQPASDARPLAPDTLGRITGPTDAAPTGQAGRQIAAENRSDDGRPRPGPERSRPAELPTESTNAVYTAAAVQHLTEVEAMLTSFKGDLGAGRLDGQLASWAKDLLSTTRLLLDSPAATDPLRRKLFQDLELVLVQIVQLSPGAPARDRDLIKGALTDDQVMTRLRTAIPSGQRGT